MNTFIKYTVNYTDERRKKKIVEMHKRSTEERKTVKQCKHMSGIVEIAISLTIDFR